MLREARFRGVIWRGIGISSTTIANHRGKHPRRRWKSSYDGPRNSPKANGFWGSKLIQTDFVRRDERTYETNLKGSEGPWRGRHSTWSG